MGRDSWRVAQQEKEREARKRRNPVWRGVGCLVVVALGLAGFFVSGWFLTANAENTWIYLPPEFIYPPPQLSFVPPGVLVRLVVGLIAVVAGYGVVSFLYAILFPIKPGETDVPKPPKPPKKKKKKRR
jgi:multisubunit Na+/H+ antiporter MnhB subunit